MKSLSANNQTHVAGQVLTLARCIMIEREDGTRMGFTDHPRDLTVNMGTGEGNETFTGTGGFNSSAHGSDVGLRDDNLDMLGVIDDVRITDEDLIGGKYEGAKFWIFDVNYTSPTDGVIRIDYGEVGDVEINDQTWIAKLRSIPSLLNQTIGDKFGRYCRATLGDSDCGVILNPDDWAASTAYAVGDVVKATSYDARRYICTTAGTSNDTEGEPTWDTTIGNTTTETDGVVWETFEAWTKEGSPTTVTSNQVFTDSSRTESANWFRMGVVTWVTGNNAGLAEQVKENNGSGQITLLHPMPFDVQTSDTYTITTGCNHLLKLSSDEWGTAYTGDCRAKFDNVVNFFAEPDIPGSDEVLKGP